jgi:hypothetical protein
MKDFRILELCTYVHVRGRDSKRLLRLRSITATPIKSIYGLISDSPEQHLLYGTVSFLISLELLGSQTEFEYKV